MPSSILPLHIEADGAKKQPVLPNSARTGISAFSTQSIAVQNLDAVIVELTQVNHDMTHLYDGDDEDTDDESDHGEPSLKHKIHHIRAEMRHFLHIPAFHYTIICLVIFDLIVVFIDLVLSLLNLPCYTELQLAYFEEHGLVDVPESSSCKLKESAALTGGEWFLWALSVFLLSIFVLELIASGIAFGLRHFKKPLYFIDALIVSISLILEIYFKVGDGGRLETAPSAIIALRLWKIVRAVHAIAHTIELKNQEIIKEVKLAKDQLEAEHQEVTDVLEQQQLRISYLRQRAPQVSDGELDEYVEKEFQKRDTGKHLREKEDASEDH